MRLLCNKCGRKAIPPQRLRGQGELMCRRHLFIYHQDRGDRKLKLLEIWERIGKQPLRITRRKDAIVFVGDSEYRIKSIRYDHGKFIGFEAEQIELIKWISEKNKPKEDKWVIVKDKDGKEYRNHQWTGHTWYDFIRSDDEYDGWRSDVDIVSWRYE